MKTHLRQSELDTLREFPPLSLPRMVAYGPVDLVERDGVEVESGERLAEAGDEAGGEEERVPHRRDGKPL